MKILMRGDCTSRRSVFYNPDLFGEKSRVIQNQKSPFILFLDHAEGADVSQEVLLPHLNMDAMPPVQKRFFLGQFERSILHQESADLLILDSYADMNFELFEENGKKGKFWVNRRYLKDVDAFSKRFHSIGRRSLEQSVEDAVSFINVVRQKYGEIPVLFLNQQVEPYPKLHSRMEFYELGRLVTERTRNCSFGGTLLAEELELADIGSCGPGLTLHYSGATYRKMLDRVAFLRNPRTISLSPPRGDVFEPKSKAADVPVSNSAPPVAMDSVKGLEISLRMEGREPPYNREMIFTTFQRYFSIPDADWYEPKVVPAVITLDEIADYENWVRATKKSVGDNAFRNERKALQRGYFAEIFDRRTFIPDIHAINTSMPVRSGQPIRAAYQRSVEELGGLPSRYFTPQFPKDECYWSLMFGAFKSVPGWRQGEVVTDKKLVGYISVRRIGEMIVYPQLLGHGDFLEDGIMVLIHFHILRWLKSAGDAYAATAKALMYTNADTPNEGLRNWKKRAGFKPRKVSVMRY